MSEQRLVQRDVGAIGCSHRLSATGIDRFEQPSDRVGAVLRNNAKRVTRVVGQAAAVQIKYDVSGVFAGRRTVERMVLEQARRERVAAIVSSGRGGRGGAGRRRAANCDGSGGNHDLKLLEL